MTPRSPVAFPDLRGQVAVVTGGRGDIGAALASALVACGAAVAVADRKAVSVGSAGDGVAHAELDVTDGAALGAWLDDVEGALGTPTLVVPAAASSTSESLLTMSAEQWRAELDTDLTAPFLLSREAARRMIRAGRSGRIVLLGSWAADAPHPHVAAYSVAKAGLRMLTRVLAVDLAAHGILVNELAIGVVDAGVSRTTFASHPELRTRSERRSPLGRLVEIDEIVQRILGLLDPRMQALTGSTLTLDAGISLRTAFSENEADPRPAGGGAAHGEATT